MTFLEFARAKPAAEPFNNMDACNCALTQWARALWPELQIRATLVVSRPAAMGAHGASRELPLTHAEAKKVFNAETWGELTTLLEAVQ